MNAQEFLKVLFPKRNDYGPLWNKLYDVVLTGVRGSVQFDLIKLDKELKKEYSYSKDESMKQFFDRKFPDQINNLKKFTFL